MKHILFTFSFSNYTLFFAVPVKQNESYPNPNSRCGRRNAYRWIFNSFARPSSNPPSSEVYYILRLGYHFFKMGNHILRWVIYWAIIFIIFYDGKPYFFPVKHLWGIAKWCQMDHQETWRCFWGSLVLTPRSYQELTKSYQSFPTFLHVFTVINPGFCTKQNTSWSSWCFQIIWFKLPDSNISNAPSASPLPQNKSRDRIMSSKGDHCYFEIFGPDGY